METLGTSGSHSSTTEKSAFLEESGDEEVCLFGTFVGFLGICIGLCLRGESSEVAAFRGLPGVFSQGAKVFVNEVAVNLFCSSLSLGLIRHKHMR